MDTLLRLSEINLWYMRSDVKFEIIKSTNRRETAFLIPSWVVSEEFKKTSIRMLKVHSVQHFDIIARTGLRLLQKNRPYNLYYSLARYTNGIPNQTFNLAERDNSEWTNGEHIKFMDAYDFLIDIDAGDIEDLDMAFESTKEIVDFFNKNNVPFELRFSGKGFHIIVPYIYFSKEKIKKECYTPASFNPKEEINFYSVYRRIAKALSNRFTEMIDLGIYDSRRLCKIPFSLALYEKEIYVCYPFDNLGRFYAFDLKQFTLTNFFYDVRQNRKVFNDKGSIVPLLEMMK
jgi:hypothetical protein